MKIKATVALTYFALHTTIVGAQQIFQVGYSSQSIDPPNELFSVALAGYGAPREGRFSLKWSQLQNEAVALRSITGNDSRLFGLTADTVVHSLVPQTGSIQWKALTTGKNFKLITANNKTLFAVNEADEIHAISLKRPGNWQKFDNHLKEIIDLAVSDNHIFVVLRSGELYKKPLSGKGEWQLWNQKGGISKITLGMGRILVLTNNNDIYRTNDIKNDIWVKISRYNDLGNNVNVKHIAVAGNQLYATNDAGVFVSRHNSENDLTASSLVIQSKKQKVLIVALDLCGVDNSFTESLKSELYKNFKIPKNAILINSSHTHFSPVGQDYSTWNPFLHKPDTNYLKIVRKAILKTTQQALKNMKRSHLEFGRGKAPIGRNRALSGTLATYDDDVDIIKITDLQKKDSILLFSVGCHPVETKNPDDFYILSANYPGLTRAQLKEKYGYHKTMFLQGCAGDINPLDKDPAVTADKLSRAVDSLAGLTLKKINGSITAIYDSVVVEATTLIPEKDLLSFKERHQNSTDVFVEKNERWADLMLKKIANSTLRTGMPVYIQMLGIGNWNLIGLSREVVTDYSLGIKKLYPEKLITVAGYSNGVESYLPTYKHIRQSTYEGGDSFFWYGQPGRFPENIYDIVIDKIQSLW